jgi:hypothetical protein
MDHCFPGRAAKGRAVRPAPAGPRSPFPEAAAVPERDGPGTDGSAEPGHAPHPPSEITSPRKAERPVPGTLIPGTRRFAAPSAASAGVAAPPSPTRRASDPAPRQRSGRQAPVTPRATADTPAAMTAESTVPGGCSRGVRRLGRATDRKPLPARKLVDDYAQFARTCQDSVSGIVGACGPKSPDSHRVVWGLTSRPPVSPRGLSPGFPFARRVPPLRPPSSGFPSSGVLRFVPFGRCPGSGSPSVSLRVPFP